MADEKKQKKKDIPKYCMECGEEISAGEPLSLIHI